MKASVVIENARVVLAESVMDGWIAISGPHIAEVGEGRAPERGVDFAGDLLVPGLIELHTDHLESHLKPRPKVRWPACSAVVAYDAQIVASGITTVFDSLRVGNDADNDASAAELWEATDAIDSARRQNLLRADHRTHLRCEICADDVVEQARRLAQQYRVDLLSLMDHTPGARQFRDIGAWKTYYGGKSDLPTHELDRFMDKKRALFAANYARNRAALVALAKAQNIAVASHDDTTMEHVEESVADGVAIAEFPTTMEAAAASHTAGGDVVARETLRLHDLIARHEHGDVSLALRSTLGSMLDFARARNVDLQHVLDAISCDYETITGRAPPALDNLGFDRDLQEPTEAGTRAGAAVVAIHTQLADIVDEDDPEIGLFHLAFTLIEDAHRRNLDFPAIAEQMLVDRAAAPAPRI